MGVDGKVLLTARESPGEGRQEAIAELAEARAQLREAHETIEAMRGGGVDSLVIGPLGQQQVYSLESADRPYRLIVEAMNEGAATVTPRGTLLNANPRLAAMTGRDPMELVGSPVLDLIPDAYRLTFARLIEVGAGDSARGEVALTGPDGTAVPVLLAVSGFDLDGTFLRCLVLADLTAQRAAENQTAMAHEARESEERLRVLFDNAPVGMGEMTLSGELVRANSLYGQILGYTVDELLSPALSRQDFTHPDDRDAELADRQRLLAGEIDTYSIEKRFLHRDGGIVWAEVNRAVVRDSAGEPLLTIATMRDLTAQREAEAEVRTLNAELEARVRVRTADLEWSNENLQAFAYSVSHDLRTPLRGMSGFSEALLTDYGDRLDETGREFARRIQAASERMGRVIDDLLSLSEVSHADMHLESVDLSAEVAGIAARLRSGEPDRLVSFAIEDDVLVTADPALIRVVLKDLIENAWKFTAGCDGATIEFATTTVDDAGFCYYVRDNGVGFDPAYSHKLFQPFQRLHAAEFDGTGIGLASVRRIVERHGGRTWAKGAVDGGATFYFTLNSRTREDSQ
ncbi:MAG TPA: PAS domain S-box protein [Streptosporangiaceae bacterium]|jgi:PAS domain S-box-containing protein|nr:PAS domain S-box protein [Streptosporangiaceae bacterium]